MTWKAPLLVGLLLLGAYGVVSLLKGYSMAPATGLGGATAGATAGAGDKAGAKNSAGAEPGQKGAGFNATRVTSAPAIASQGPYPKAVFAETEHAFGRMEVGQEDSHDFVIKNEGEAELEIAKGSTTCQCTISEVGDNRIPPGGTATITLRWKPTQQTDNFEKGAEILTNDPVNPVFQLKILGMVVPRFVLMPSDNWEIREVNESQPSTTMGLVLSPVIDDLGLDKLIYDETRMKIKVHPATAEQVAQMQGKSGFGLEVSVLPGMPVGTFQYPLQIVTNAPERKADGTLGEKAILKVNITGRRDGPVRILGPAFRQEASAIALGAFPATDGKSVTLNLLVRECPDEGLKILSVETDPPELAAEFTGEPKAVGVAMRHTLKLTMPGSTNRILKNEESPGLVLIKTNHTQAPEIRLKVFLNAY